MLWFLVAFQLLFDFALFFLLLLVLQRQRELPAPSSGESAAWQSELLEGVDQFVGTARRLLESMNRPEEPAPAPRPAPDRLEPAVRLLTRGVGPKEVARRTRLFPGEVDLLRRLQEKFPSAATK